MKMDGRLGCNPLKGALDDALHAVMCGAGRNLRPILAKLRLLCEVRVAPQAPTSRQFGSPHAPRPFCGPYSSDISRQFSSFRSTRSSKSPGALPASPLLVP